MFSYKNSIRKGTGFNVHSAFAIKHFTQSWTMMNLVPLPTHLFFSVVF